MQIIDPHLHFFALEEGQYHWLQPQNPPFWADKQKLHRDFNEHSLVINDAHTLAGIVHIEAGFDNARPWREIDYLENHVTLPLKTVAGVDLLATDMAATLAQLAGRTSVVGVRHILDESACELLSSPLVQQNLALLVQQQLHFEVQMPVANTRAVALLGEVIKRTGLRCIVNHAGWPAPDANSYPRWLDNMSQLAGFSECTVKVSGFEMLNRQRTCSEATMARALEALLQRFGQHRVMLASNFPVCLLSCSYRQLWQRYMTLMSRLSLPVATQQALLSENARHWYQFS
ncbi:amidohydrolase family protein [Salinimonas marina]|uniref:Amidohydrolase family protein n=1 Tax=Salinimonas marina TaxID=2785918 RepID=A0A7S9HCM0_9ALTE|nr:amidohydrolase family protein [Salinimonas marina]QPG05254.1 amidohydrolase family protein [Salinimonas marina]